MGVWIETFPTFSLANHAGVTPCVGVWIETYFCRYLVLSVDVTPCVGVWIETLISRSNGTVPWSHPAWVCGLKLVLKYAIYS